MTYYKLTEEEILMHKEIGEALLARIEARTKEEKEKAKELAKKVEYVVVSQGSEGSICSHAGKFYQVTTPRVVTVNDTGAGDCFVGAFLSGLSLNRPLTEILAFASACAASKVQHNDSTTFSVKEARIFQKKVTVKML